jgi:hypothetical protein
MLFKLFAIDLYLLNFAVFQITNKYFLKMRNAVSNKGEPRKILGGKNLTVARATFATVWIRACHAPWDHKLFIYFVLQNFVVLKVRR